MKPAILVHGGAGRIAEADQAAHLAGCETAAEAGWSVLQAGGGALDAVCAAAVVLEDDPHFNAGTGSVLDVNGHVATDAAVMVGDTLAAGAVAAVSGIRNPVLLARAVMEHSRHVLLAGEGAFDFARAQGIESCDPAELAVPRQQARWEADHGTIGAVAMDAQGRLAAGTSTGGTFRKLSGRVGDSPLIGCGTYADEFAAVSSTGDGEDIIRLVLARRVAEAVAGGLDAAQAAQRAIALFAGKVKGEAGVIVVDRAGHIGFARNSREMPVCGISAQGRVLTC